MEATKNKTIINHITVEPNNWKNEFTALYPDPSFIEKVLSYPHAHFAAYNGEKIVGHAIIHYIENKWVLGSIVVKPEFRQQGIGKALTKVRIDYAKKLGIRKLWYHSKNDNLMAICCHVGSGFKKTCSHETNCTPAKAHWYYIETSIAFNPELN